MTTDILLQLALILLNGVVAMSEIAVVSSRRARLVSLGIMVVLLTDVSASSCRSAWP